MSIKILFSKGKEVQFIQVNGWDDKLVPLSLKPDQNVLVHDGIYPSLSFRPPLSEVPVVNGVAEKVSEIEILGLSGDFVIQSRDFKLWGNAVKNKLKEPDNHLM